MKRWKRVVGVIAAGLGLVAPLAITTSSASAAPAAPTAPTACVYYAHSGGFGVYCFSGTGGGPLLTWRDRLNGKDFIPCMTQALPDWYEAPGGAPGSQARLMVTMENFDLDLTNGGPPDYKYEIVSLTQQQLTEYQGGDCPRFETIENGGGEYSYMKYFWQTNRNKYPEPLFKMEPIDTPRVGAKAFISLPDSSMTAILCADGRGPRQGIREFSDCGANRFVDAGQGAQPMQGRVQKLEVTLPDGESFDCAQFHENYPTDPEQAETTGNDCYLTFDRSSANQEDKVYDVKVTLHWEVFKAVRCEGGALPLPGHNYCKDIVNGDVPVEATFRIPVVEANNNVGS